MSDIYLSLTETPSVVTLSQPVVSGVLSSNVTVTNVVSVNVVTMPAINVTAAAPAVTTVAGTVAVSNFPSVTTVAGTVALDANSLSALENVTVTVGAAVSVSNFPSTQTIVGTVTANVSFPEVLQTNQRLSANGGDSFEEGGYISCQVIPDYYQIGLNRILPECYVADGEVTARVGPNDVQRQLIILQALGSSGDVYDVSSFGNGTMFVLEPFSFTESPVVKLQYRNSGNTAGEDIVVTNAFKTTSTTNISTADTYVFRKDTTRTHIRLAWVSGTGSASFRLKVHSNPFFGIERPISGTVTVGNSVTIGSVPNGSLTTRFGTPTTANTAFATSAVTNANRKYLLIQNVTTGSNVITVGIGFTPTTTQGIQLTAGAGITFESSYIPTGAVYVLSSVTASNYTILEA